MSRAVEGRVMGCVVPDLEMVMVMVVSSCGGSAMRNEREADERGRMN